MLHTSLLTDVHQQHNVADTYVLEPSLASISHIIARARIRILKTKQSWEKAARSVFPKAALRLGKLREKLNWPGRDFYDGVISYIEIWVICLAQKIGGRYYHDSNISVNLRPADSIFYVA